MACRRDALQSVFAAKWRPTPLGAHLHSCPSYGRLRACPLPAIEMTKPRQAGVWWGEGNAPMMRQKATKCRRLIHDRNHLYFDELLGLS